MIGLGWAELLILGVVGAVVLGGAAAVALLAVAASRKGLGDRQTIAQLAEENRRLRDELAKSRDGVA